MKEKRGKQNNKLIKKSARALLDEEISQLQKRYAQVCDEVSKLEKFADFPLSQKTQKGLTESKYIQPTDIQRASIPPALQGKDVLGAAITGSGKTLAFLIPVLEHLFLNKWSRSDGVCAIIISPTRELAYQIFETLKKVGKYHDFSAGLIIGGKNLKFERQRMDQCNILICTPGRLLQHMDENPLFQTSTMEMLVLDEADRCLDMGFEQCLNAIIENFPPQKQTLLFSATQTRSVKDLARLNLKDPIYVGFGEIHYLTKENQQDKEVSKVENQKTLPLVVPELLKQSYVVVNLEDKLTMLWSFIKNHLKQKIIVFLASCKQVKYFYEILCKLRPGTCVLALYGTLHQDRRLAIYEEFSRKSNVVMLATDIASRGLDFPGINWVIQLDCPEDVNQYIHRAGRSARNKTHGESLLVLMPSEETGMLAELEHKFIHVQKILIDPKKLFSPLAKIQGFLAQDQELKASAQRAFISYIKSVFLMKNKKIFDVRALKFNEYAMSLGLVITPRVRFLDRYIKKQSANMAGEEGKVIKQEPDIHENGKKIKEELSADETEVSEDDNDIPINKVEEKDDKCEPIFSTLQDTFEESDDEDFLTIKRANHSLLAKDEEESVEMLPELEPRKTKGKLLTKATLAKRVLKKKLNINSKIQFDEGGNEIKDERKHLQSELAQKYINDNNCNDSIEDDNSNGGINIELSKQLLLEEDKHDKERFRQLVKKRHKKLKEKLKNKNGDNDNDSNEEEEEEFTESEDDRDTINTDYSLLHNNSTSFKPSSDIEEDMVSNSDNENRAENSDDFLEEPLHKKMKITSKLSLTDAEAIAAQLLTNS